MRKLLFILSVIIPSIGFCQSYIGGKLIGSYSYSRQNTTYPRIGASGGLFIQKDFNDKVSIRQEALIRLDGYSIKDQVPVDLDSNGDTIRDLGIKKMDYRLNSLELPFFVLYKFGNKIQPYMALGPSLKIIYWSKRRVELDPTVFGSNKSYQFININSSSIDICLNANLGVEFKIKETPIHIEARYSHGLINIFNNNRLSSISLMTGIKF